MLAFQQQQKILTEILKNKSNYNCADCSTISPTWASIDFGVFLCSNCSGAHRSLGPTVTRVRSTKLDKWQADWVDLMRVGNIQLNLYWEAQFSSENSKLKKPTSISSLDQVKKYVTQKYIKKRFIPKGFQKADPRTYYKSIKQVPKQANQSKSNSEDAIKNTNFVQKNQTSQASASNFGNLLFDQIQSSVRSSNQNSENTQNVQRSQVSPDQDDDQQFGHFTDGRSTNDISLSGQPTYISQVTGSTATDHSKLSFEQLMNQNRQKEEQKRRQLQLQMNLNNNMIYQNGAYHFNSHNTGYNMGHNQMMNNMMGQYNMNYLHSMQHQHHNIQHHHHPLHNYNHIVPNLHKTHSLGNPQHSQNIISNTYNFNNNNSSHKNQDDWSGWH